MKKSDIFFNGFYINFFMFYAFICICDFFCIDKSPVDVLKILHNSSKELFYHKILFFVEFYSF